MTMEAKAGAVTLVVAEAARGVLNRASLEAVTAAQVIGDTVVAAVAGADTAAAAETLAGAGVTEVVRLEHDALATYTADGFVEAFAAFIADLAPATVVWPHTYQTRDFAPRLAARLGRPLVTDCLAARRDADVRVFTRPMFQGKLHADVVIDGPPPALVTVQLGAFAAASAVANALAPVRVVRASVTAGAIRQRPEPPARETAETVNLADAERIVAVGRGIKDQDRLAIVRELAEALGAEIAASRPICDAGWLPLDRQIGSSGQAVAPKLYVALGISGAIQHLVGVRGARTIVAVNTDPDAPIFEVADYGIVGDLFEVVPAMIQAIREAESLKPKTEN